MKLAACLLFAAFSLTAQQNDQCYIAGRVLNAANGLPVRKAKLTLDHTDNPAGGEDWPSYTTVTDDQGRFAMKDIEPGKYELSAQRAGFGAGDYGPALSLAAGQRLSGIVLKLTPYAVITGRILDEDGEPLEHVRVTALRYSYWKGKRQLGLNAGAATDDLGEYRLFDLAPGRYYLQAADTEDYFQSAQAQKRSATKPLDEVHVPTYYPGTSNFDNAIAVELKAGAEARGMDFSFFKVRAVRVGGHVKYPADSDRKGVMIILEPRDSRLVRWSLTRRAETVDPDGKFELTKIAPGSYSLSAILLDGSNSISARQQIDVGSDNVENVVLNLAAGVSLPGRIIFEGPPPANLTQIEVSLRDPDDREIRFGPTPGKVKADSTFTLANVGADDYRVVVQGLPDNYYVQSVRIGDKRSKESSVDTTNGAGGAFVITVSAKAGQIEGVVLNGKHEPAPGATVLLVPGDKDATTDQYGRFVITTIEPGEYKLFAWEGDPDDYMDVEALKPVEECGHSVHIHEGSRERVELH